MMTVGSYEDLALRWEAATHLAVSGRGWGDVKDFYNRLPARAEGMVPPAVWELSRQPAGISVGFSSDASNICFRWTLLDEKLDGFVTSRVGASGLDLYALEEDGWRYLGVGIPNARNASAWVLRNLPPEKRNYLLYLPLRNGIERLEIGVDTWAQLMPSIPFCGKPIVYYGTSIVHGEGASRPGMCHSSIIGRRINREVINLGFAGSGTMDIKIAQLMTGLESALYIIDCLPNMTADLIDERAVPFVEALRRDQPDTPILLIEDRTYSRAWLSESVREEQRSRRQSLRKAFDSLITSGFTELYYVEGEQLLGNDGEATVDGSHPNDLGYFRYADSLQPLLITLLKD